MAWEKRRRRVQQQKHLTNVDTVVWWLRPSLFIGLGHKKNDFNDGGDTVILQKKKEGELA